MEKRISSKTRLYFQNFKDVLKSKIVEDGKMDPKYMNELVQFIYDYPQLTFLPQDFQKRKRVKNIVPFFERCCALRANGEQCTRRKKDHPKFCGTHVKGTPHGLICSEISDSNQEKKMDVFAEEINGIVYFLDKFNNIYNTEDIMKKIVNPRIIGRYRLIDNKYMIDNSLFV